MCRLLATSTDATATPGSDDSSRAVPVVAVLDSPPINATEDVWDEHVAQARGLLASNRVVVIRNVEKSGPPFSWSLGSFCRMSNRYPDGARIQWHCKLLFMNCGTCIAMLNGAQPTSKIVAIPLQRPAHISVRTTIL